LCAQATNAAVQEAIAELAKQFPGRAAEAEALGVDLQGELAEIRAQEDAEVVLSARVNEMNAKCGLLKHAQNVQEEKKDEAADVPQEQREQSVGAESCVDNAGFESSLKARVRAGELTMQDMRDILDRRSLMQKLDSASARLAEERRPKPQVGKLGPSDRKAKVYMTD